MPRRASEPRELRVASLVCTSLFPLMDLCDLGQRKDLVQLELPNNARAH